jgi:hypothetical protein
LDKNLLEKKRKTHCKNNRFFVKFQVEQEIKAKVRHEVLDSCEIHKKKRKRPMVAKKLKNKNV